MELDDEALAAYWSWFLPALTSVEFEAAVADPGNYRAWLVLDDLGQDYVPTGVSIYGTNLLITHPSIASPRVATTLVRTAIPIDGYDVLGRPLSAPPAMPITPI